MSFKLNFSGLSAARTRFANKAKSEKTAATKTNHPLSRLTGQTTTENLVAKPTKVERQIFGPRVQTQTAVVPQNESLPQAAGPASFSGFSPQFSAQAPVSGYGAQYTGQPPGGTTNEQNEVEPQNNNVSLDGSDRKFYIRSPEPGALQRFDEQYALQLAAQEAEADELDEVDEAYQAEVEQVREVAAQGDNVATAQAVEQAAEVYADDPEVVDQLIHDLQPEIEQASAGLSTEDYGRDEALATVTSFSRVAELASEDGAQALAEAVVRENNLNTADNSSELWYLDDAINKIPQGGGITFGLALADELELHGRVNAAKDVRKDVIDNLDSLTEYVEDSAEDREELDAQLTESLSSFQGLNEQEVADYISIYQQENIEAYSAESNSAARLNEVLARNGDALDQMVADNRVTGVYGIVSYPHADNVVDAYATLAESSLPALASEWALKPRSEEVAAAYASPRLEIQEKVLEPALAGTLLQYQAEEGDPEAALDRFEALFSNLELGKSILSKTSDLTDLLDTSEESIAELRDLLSPGGIGRYRDSLETNVLEIGELTPLDAAFEVTGLTFAIVNFGEAEGFVENATAALSVTSGGLDLLSKSIDTLNKKGRLGFLTDDGLRHATRFSRFGARMVPYINVGLNIAATIASGRKFAEDPSMGRLLAVVGDGLSLIGAAVGVFGVTKPLAAILEFGGLALSEIGTYWAEAGERNEINDDEERILTAVFEHRYPELKEEIGDEAFGDAVRQLADASDPTPAEVFERADLNTEQLLRLFGTVPGSNNREGRRLLDYTEAHNLTGDDFVEFAQKMDEAGVINGYDIAFLDGATLLGWNPEQAVAALEQLGSDGGFLLATRYLDFVMFTDGRNPGHLAVMYEQAGVDFDALGLDIEDYYEGDG